VTEFRRVGLAEHNRACPRQSFDGGGARLWHAILHREGSHGSRNACEIIEVFDRDWNAMQRS
jgi:hypothetical protein